RPPHARISHRAGPNRQPHDGHRAAASSALTGAASAVARMPAALAPINGALRRRSEAG
ncbi:hypothetical protein GW17_00018354, partial [Ensete ventricosum]